MAYEHAQSALHESGWTLDPYKDYDLEIFRRRFAERVEQEYRHHDLELYDFLKKASSPGPDRFVIAYDNVTKATYLRQDLRSNENLANLPRATILGN